MSSQWGDGRYEARSLLGRGGTAEVWRATDRLLRRDVAVKSFARGTLTGDEQDAEDAEDAARFRAETRLLARLDHPNVVRVLDAGVSADDPWYVMPLADAGSLARPDAVRESGALLRLGAQIADALAYVHGCGIVHRDVKPSNILLDGEGRALLSDFGVAQVSGATRITRTGLLIGTVAFLAPEQVRGVTVGPAADVYALGLVLLERLTGRREYAGPPAEAAVARLVRPPTVPATLPANLAALITAMTATDPAARPSAAEVRDVLARVGTDPAGAVPAGASAPAAPAVRPPVFPRPALAPPGGARRPRPRARPSAPGVAAAVLSGAFGGGGLVALLLTGGLLGPLRDAPPMQKPPAVDQIGGQAAAGSEAGPAAAPRSTASPTTRNTRGGTVRTTRTPAAGGPRREAGATSSSSPTTSSPIPPTSSTSGPVDGFGDSPADPSAGTASPGSGPSVTAPDEETDPLPVPSVDLPSDLPSDPDHETDGGSSDRGDQGDRDGNDSNDRGDRIDSDSGSDRGASDWIRLAAG